MSKSTNFVGMIYLADKEADLSELNVVGNMIPNLSMVGVCVGGREHSPLSRRDFFPPVVVCFSLDIFMKEKNFKHNYNRERK